MSVVKTVHTLASEMTGLSLVLKGYSNALKALGQTEFGMELNGIVESIESFRTTLRPTVYDLQAAVKQIMDFTNIFFDARKEFGYYNQVLKEGGIVSGEVAQSIEDRLTQLKAAMKLAIMGVHANKEYIESEIMVALQQDKMRETSFRLLGGMFGLQFTSSMLNKTFGKLYKSGTALGEIFETLDWFMEDMGDILGDALEPAFIIIEDVLDTFIMLMEDQPDVVNAFIGAVILLAPILVGLLATVTQLGVAFLALQSVGGISGLFQAIGISAGVLSSALSVLVLGAVSFTALKTILDLLFPSMDNTSKTMIALGGTILFLAVAMNANLIGAIMNALSAFGLWLAEMVLMHAPIQLLTLGIGGLTIAIGALIGGLLLGIGLLKALPENMRPIAAAAMVAIGAIVALTIAYLAMHGAMAGALAPVVLPIILGSIGIAVAGLLALLAPHLIGLQEGGLTKGEGVAYLHRNEVVSPAKMFRESKAKSPEYESPIIVNIQGATSFEEIVRRGVEAGIKRERQRWKLSEYGA